MILQAIGNNIIIKPIYTEQKSSLIIPESAREFKLYYGRIYGMVISIGRDFRYKDDLKVGDKVVWVRHEGKRVLYQNQEYFAVRERWVLGKLEEE